MNLRRRFIIYLVVVHAMLAALAWWLLQQNILWLIAIEIVFILSLAVGIAIVTRLSSTLVTVRQSAQMLREGEFTTRFLEVGHPDVDTMIRVYNRMVDNLREERVRLQEQQYFLGQLLAASPGGVIVLDHDGRVSAVNPAAARLLQVPAAAVEGRTLADLRAPLAEALERTAPGDTCAVTLSNGGRVRGQCATFVERGHPRRFYLVEELTEELRQTEKSAYEKLIRQMSHEVNNTVGATRSLLQSSLAYGEGMPAPRQAEMQEALGIAGDRLERLNTFMRGFADVVRMPQPVKRPTDVLRLLDACVRLVRTGLSIWLSRSLISLVTTNIRSSRRPFPHTSV
ncbi:MAG: PAS domain-containing protein, partial [Vicinamibacterales bacterium]